MMLFATANAQQTFKLNHAWESCSLCEQTKGHYYTVKDADLIKDKDLHDYAIIYKSRKNGGNYLFGTDADKDCPQSNSGKHSWKTYSETLTINVTKKDLQDFIELRDGERNKLTQEKCIQYNLYAKDYRIGIVNKTLVRISYYLEFFFHDRALKEYYWDNINLSNIETLIFSKNIAGKSDNLLQTLNTNDFKKIRDLCELLLKDEVKILIPLSDKEIEFYGGKAKFCNIDNADISFSLNPVKLINSEIYSGFAGEKPFIAKYYNTVLNLSYARALKNLNRKNEALDIYNKTDLTELLQTLPVGYRAKGYYFSKTSNPGETPQYGNEPDKNDRIFGYMSIFSYINLCKDLNVQPKITEKELEDYLNEYRVLSEELRLVPSDYWSMASSLINQSDYPNAMHLLKFGIEKFPNNQEALKNLNSGYNKIGWDLILKKEFQAALFYLKEGTEIFPSNLFIIGNLAHAYLLTGDYKTAKKMYTKNKGINLTPELSWVSMVNGDFKDFQAAGITNKHFQDILQLMNK
jgi:tetratricopeptide (TPR) repeat protein